MNYQRIYDEIINNATSRGLNKKLLDGYYERHHVIPKCLGGMNDKNNLVLLTGREHYICHWLLWKINREDCKLFTAYHKMVYCKDISQQRNFNITSKQYEILRLNISNICSERFKNSIPWNK